MKKFVIQQCYAGAFTGWGHYHTMRFGATREQADAEVLRLGAIFPGHVFRVMP